MNFTEEDYWSVDSAITDQGWVFDLTIVYLKKTVYGVFSSI